MSQTADFIPSRSSGYIPTKEQSNSVNDVNLRKFATVSIYTYIYIIYIYI